MWLTMIDQQLQETDAKTKGLAATMMEITQEIEGGSSKRLREYLDLKERSTQLHIRLLSLEARQQEYTDHAAD